MQDIKKVLCVIDPTVFEQPAADRAVWFAEKCGAEVEFFICYYNEYLSGERFFAAEALSDLRQSTLSHEQDYLTEFVGKYTDRNVQISTQAAWDYPLHDGIVRHAIKSKADIVFKDAHAHSKLARLALTNTDWNLMRSLPMPLWLVHAGEFSDEPVFVTAVDPMHEHDKPAELDHKLLKVTEFMKDKVHADAHILHTFDSSAALASAATGTYVPLPVPIEAIQKNIRDLHKKEFDDLISGFTFDEDHIHLVSGKAKDELPRVAELLNASVVVMGAVARNRWKQIFIGSTAEKVIDKLPCDLLVVKPDWFEVPADIIDEKHKEKKDVKAA